MDDLISVIVPVFNVEKIISYCIESLLAQTYSNFELILVDDGSQDNSLMLCKKFAFGDSRIRVFNKDNGGASAARNLGLRNAKGSFIVFVDSDDYVSVNYLENLYLATILGNFNIVQCKFEITSNLSIGNIQIKFRSSDVIEISKKQALNDRLYKVSVCGKMYSSHIFLDFQFKEGTIYEDDASYYVFVDRADRIAILDEPLYFYYMSNNSVMRNNNSNKSLSFVNIYKERIQYFLLRDNPILMEGSYSRFCLVLMLFISNALVYGNNKSDINQLKKLFNHYYWKTIGAKSIKRKDKIMFTCFRIAPSIVGRVIGCIRGKT